MTNKQTKKQPRENKKTSAEDKVTKKNASSVNGKAEKKSSSTKPAPSNAKKPKRKINPQRVGEEILNLFYLLAGAFITGLAINIFFIPNNLSMGGVSGVAHIINILTGDVLPLGSISLLLNIPILICGWRYFGFSMVYRSLIGSVLFSLGIDFTSTFTNQVFTQWINDLGYRPDTLVFAIVAGLLYGLGLGLILRGDYTTGGSDILAFIVFDKFNRITVGQFLFFFDVIVILLNTLINYVYGIGNIAEAIMTGIYSFAALYITSKITDLVLLGTDSSRACYIISDQSDEISKAILDDLERGVTGFNGMGMYTKNEKNILLVVLNSREVPELRRIVEAIDENAFMIVAEVKEVSGEGFTKEND